MAYKIPALIVNMETTPTTPDVVKKVYIHPPSAARVMLPDGRYIAYKEQGVPADNARFSIISPHSFLSSRLAGAMFFFMAKPTDNASTFAVLVYFRHAFS